MQITETYKQELDNLATSAQVEMKNAAVARAPPVQRSAPKAEPTFYRPELDALRFIAFLMIFVHHMLPHDPHAYGHGTPHFKAFLLANAAACLGAGLPLFFSLSAYLLTVLLLREKRRSGTVHMKAFYVRRILRIWPLYFLAIGLAWLGARFIEHDHRSGIFIAYIFMLGNWIRQMGLTAKTPVEIGHLWSISVEEQFYLIFPGLIKFANRRILLAFAAAVSFVSLGTLIFLAFHGTPTDEIWRNSFVQFLMFAAGIALGVYTDRRGLPTMRNSYRLLLLVLSMGLFFAAESYSGALLEGGAAPSAMRLIAWYFPVALGCGMLLIGTLGYARRLPSSLVYLGKISYGLYVFHAWGLNGASALLGRLGLHHSLALKDVLAFALTIIAAMISYRIYETPFLKLKNRFSFVHTRPV